MWLLILILAVFIGAVVFVAAALAGAAVAVVTVVAFLVKVCLELVDLVQQRRDRVR